ncbi:hypothetical protein D3C75_864820 [compost metagenome]
MVFFINHDADRLILIQDNRTAPGVIGQIRADEVLLHKHFFVQLIELIQLQQLKAAEIRSCFPLKNRSKLLQHLFRLLCRSQQREGKMLQIAGDPHPTADDNLGMTAAAAHPVAKGLFGKPET